jgi:hypothetical protein
MMQATRKNGNLWKILRLAEKFQAREHSRTFENISLGRKIPGEKISARLKDRRLRNKRSQANLEASTR